MALRNDFVAVRQYFSDKMAPSIGLNLRVTGYCNQGGRKYMEDVFSVAYLQTEDEKDLEYAFFGIFDGHGGREAAVFAKEHLMDFIVKQKLFWADDDESVLRAIREGFIQTHQAMWGELEKWPKTVSGLPSTAGTTASIAFIRRGKIYVGHVGDSAIVLGFENKDENDANGKVWSAKPLTRDHKPESDEESRRIERSGGKVICKSGVPRVVWNRPKMGHKGPVRRSTHIDEIPFLAVARSLGDLWSYNSEEDVFVVSPEPDTYVYPIDIEKNRCLILGTDGAWNMLTGDQAVAHVCHAERSNEQHMLYPHGNVMNGSNLTSGRQWINPSKYLVDRAIERWNGNNLRADNTSIVTVMLDPPGPPRAQALKRQRELAMLNSKNGVSNSISSQESAETSSLNIDAQSDKEKRVSNRENMEFESRGSVALVTNTEPPAANVDSYALHKGDQKDKDNEDKKIDKTGNICSVSIISRNPNSKNIKDVQGHGLVPSSSRLLHDFQTASSTNSYSSRPLPPLPPTLPNKHEDSMLNVKTLYKPPGVAPSGTNDLGVENHAALDRIAENSSAPSTVSNADSCSESRLHGPRNYQSTKYASTGTNVPGSSQNLSSSVEPSSHIPSSSHNKYDSSKDINDIQCNEISSSDDDSPSQHKSVSILNPAVVSSSRNKHVSKVLKETRLSRELNSLRLNSPGPGFALDHKAHRRTNQLKRTHFETGSHNSSDTENEDHVVNRPKAKRSLRSSAIELNTFSPTCDEIAVLEQCEKLNNRIRNMERKVARKTEELNKQVRQLQSTLIGAGQCSRKLKSRSTTNDHYLRSGQNVSLKPSQAQKLHRSTVASQSRSLRSNNSPRSILKNKSSCSTGLAPVSASSRRKREALAANHIENIRIQSPRSPRNIASSVVRASAINKRPIIHTRSRRARVLHLKK